MSAEFIQARGFNLPHDDGFLAAEFFHEDGDLGVDQVTGGQAAGDHLRRSADGQAADRYRADQRERDGAVGVHPGPGFQVGIVVHRNANDIPGSHPIVGIGGFAPGGAQGEPADKKN